MELDPRSSSQLCLCSDQQAIVPGESAALTASPPHGHARPPEAELGRAVYMYIYIYISWVSWLADSPACSHPDKSALAPITTSQYNSQLATASGRPLRFCFGNCQAHSVARIRRSRWPRLNHHKTHTHDFPPRILRIPPGTAPLLTMGKGKMDEAAAARIRKARGEKVRLVADTHQEYPV